MARSGQDAFHTDVHPGHLIQTAAGADQTILFHFNMVVSTLPVTGHDPLQNRVYFFHEAPVLGALQILPDAVDQQQGSIHGVIHGLCLTLGEEVGHKAVLFISQEGAQDALGIGITAGGQAAAGEGDHGIATPVGEQGIACQNGLAVCGIPAGDVGIRSQHQLTGQRIFQIRQLQKAGHAADLGLDNCLGRGNFPVHGQDDLKFFGFAGSNFKIHRADSATHALLRTAILGIFGVGKILPDGLHFGQSAARVNVHGVLAVGDGVAGEGKILLFFQRLLLGNKLAEGFCPEGRSLTAAVFHGVGNGGGVPFKIHGADALHGNAVHLVSPNGQHLIGKAGLVDVAVFGLGIIGKCLGGQPVGLAAQGHLFPHPVDQGDAHIGRFLRCHQQAHIAAVNAVAACDGSITAQAVGQQEILFLRPVQIAHLLFSVKKLHFDLRRVTPYFDNFAVYRYLKVYSISALPSTNKICSRHIRQIV